MLTSVTIETGVDFTDEHASGTHHSNPTTDTLSAADVADDISGGATADHIDPNEDTAFEAEVEALRQSLEADLTLSITTTVKQQALIAIYEEMLVLVQARDRAKLRQFLDLFDKDDLLSSVDAFLERSSVISASQALGEVPMAVVGLERLRGDLRKHAERLVSSICSIGR